MSIPVSLDDLPEQVARFGATPFLITVSGDATPHACSVRVTLRVKLFLAGCGRQTTENIRKNHTVALLWPALSPGEHALIVDGRADVIGSADKGFLALIKPSKAVLHVTPAAPEVGVNPHPGAGVQ